MMSLPISWQRRVISGLMLLGFLAGVAAFYGLLIWAVVSAIPRPEGEPPHWDILASSRVAGSCTTTDEITDETVSVSYAGELLLLRDVRTQEHTRRGTVWPLDWRQAREAISFRDLRPEHFEAEALVLTGRTWAGAPATCTLSVRRGEAAPHPVAQPLRPLRGG